MIKQDEIKKTEIHPIYTEEFLSFLFCPVYSEMFSGVFIFDK